jgi:hypothetical protein
MDNSRVIKINLSIAGNVKVTFFDISYNVVKLYDKCSEFERQKKIKHLGLIADVIESSNHTRYEYLLLQCFFTEIIENTYKGTSNALGSIKINGIEVKGSELIKSWFLLSNFGHTIKTFGDEKALLLFTYERKGFRNKLIADIEDDDLKKYSNKVIDDFDYPGFHNVLSIWRIYKTIRNKRERGAILNIYKLYLLDDFQINVNKAKLSVLKYISKFIREVALVTIDSHHTHMPFSLNPFALLMSMDLFENRFKNDSILNVLYPISSLLVEEIYLKKEVLTMQRAYEISSIESIKQRNARYQEYDKIIDEAFKQGILQCESVNISHFFRFKIPYKDFENNLLSEYRYIQKVKRNCINIETSLDYNPITKEKIYDFFIHKSFDNGKFPVFVFNLLSLLEEQISNTANQEIAPVIKIDKLLKKSLQNKNISDKEITGISQKITEIYYKDIVAQIKEVNLPTFRDVLWSILRYFIEDRYSFEIGQHKYPFDVVGVKLLKLPIDTIINNISIAVKDEKDTDRVHELNHLKKAIDKNYNGFQLACLCRINIYDLSKPPDKRIITDIDSVLVKVNSDEFIIEFHESKNTPKSETDARKDLRNKFLKTLNKNASGYQIYDVKKMGAKLRIKINAV